MRASFGLLALCLFAQQQPTIKTRVPLVIIPVSVTDTNKHPVYGLAASDFRVTDNGAHPAIRVDDPDAVVAPFNLVVAVQTTDISHSALLKLRKVGTMIQDAVVGANGAAAVVTFADQVHVAHDLTSSANEIQSTFRSLDSANTRKGRLIDAVAKSLSLLENKPQAARSAILIVGESKDRGSETKLEDLLPALQRSGVTVYSLSYSTLLTPLTTKASEYKPPEGGRGWILDSITETAHATKQDTCKILTGATGGRRFKFETQSKLENELIQLGGEIHSRYIVSFTPPEPRSSGFHKVKVEISGRPELHVDARPGYWTGADSSR